MGSYQSYSVEEFKIESKILKEILLRFKEEGKFDKVKKHLDHLLIIDKIDGEEYVFLYKNTINEIEGDYVKVNPSFNFPKSKYELIPAMLEIICKNVVMSNDDIEKLKSELIDKNEEILKNDLEANCIYYVYNGEYRLQENSEYVKLESILNNTYFLYTKEEKNCISDNGFGQHPSDFETKKSVDYLRNIPVANYRLENDECCIKRDIKNYGIWYFSKEGQIEQEKETKAKRKQLHEIAVSQNYNVPIEDLDLGASAFYCLRRAGVNTLGEIIKLDFESLRTLPHLRRCGKITFERIWKRIWDYDILPKDWPKDYDELKERMKS